MKRARFVGGALALAAGALLLAGCDRAAVETPAKPDAETVRQRLVGTWLRVYEQDGTRVRRILVLQDDGRFRETYRTEGQTNADLSPGHSGTWLFDGTNLKRHYQYVDGKQTTRASVLFAALEVRFSGKHEFTGTDHVRKRQVSYQRVEEGTQP